MIEFIKRWKNFVESLRNRKRFKRGRFTKGRGGDFHE